MKQKGMLLGLVLMIIGIVCWLMVKYVLYDIKVLYPVGCIILCVGGLIVTINLFINTVKDDKILRSKIDQKKEKE